MEFDSNVARPIIIGGGIAGLIAAPPVELGRQQPEYFRPAHRIQIVGEIQLLHYRYIPSQVPRALARNASLGGLLCV